MLRFAQHDSAIFSHLLAPWATFCRRSAALAALQISGVLSLYSLWPRKDETQRSLKPSVTSVLKSLRHRGRGESGSVAAPLGCQNRYNVGHP